ncbi:hypothetical protein V8E53_005542 [Lactarius tabidus]
MTPILVRISSMTTYAATWAPRTPSFPNLRKHDDNHGGSDVEWSNLPSSPAPCTASKTTMETAFGGTPSTPSSSTFDDDDDGDSDGATLSSCAASTTTGAVTRGWDCDMGKHSQPRVVSTTIMEAASWGDRCCQPPQPRLERGHSAVVVGPATSTAMATDPAIWGYLLPSPALATSMKTMGPAVGQSDDDGARVGRLVVGRRKHRRSTLRLKTFFGTVQL